MIYNPTSSIIRNNVSARGLREFDINSHTSPFCSPILIIVVKVTKMYRLIAIMIAIKNALSTFFLDCFCAGYEVRIPKSNLPTRS